MIFAVETSCDETSCAIYDDEKHQLLSNIVYSQIDLHKKFGGVIPELASHAQLEKITLVAREAFDQAKKELSAITTIGVTYKPGLPGSLLVGVAFAKALAWVAQNNIIGINHLEGHIFSPFLEYQVPFPHLCLTASGGHTSLYVVKDYGHIDMISTTLDDAAGEAFDKIAKLLGLPYPGGPIIETLAREVGFQDFYYYPRATSQITQFSFSGLKTAVLYDLAKRGWYDFNEKKLSLTCTLEIKKKIASSLLVCIKDIFLQKIIMALKTHPHIKALTFVGGVACNQYLKQELKNFAQSRGIDFFSPSKILCTDNAGMIAFVTAYKVQQGHFSSQTLDIFDS